jgi:3-oxoacyl-[acyl-carrier-protein] synthase II
MSCISAQESYAGKLPEPQAYTDRGRLETICPDYKSILPAKSLRRMSHTVKMGTAAALRCLQDAGIEKPCSISVGTSLGCLADTAKFLSQMQESADRPLNPTAFIQSTHNTVSGQIALILGCTGRNFTFSQNEASFEAALADSAMFLQAGLGSSALVGGIDEATPELEALLAEAGCAGGADDLPLGESAAFFVLETQKKAEALARIASFGTYWGINSGEQLLKIAEDIISAAGLVKEEINMLLAGDAGAENAADCKLLAHYFCQAAYVEYCSYCGRHDNSAAYALWQASKLISSGKASHGLIYSQGRGKSHSFILVSAC